MKRIAILLLCAVLLLFLFINSWKSVRGTICDFDEKTGSMTVVAEDGQKYIVNDYLKHIPTGVWGDRIFEKCGIRRDEEGDGGKTLEIRGKRRLSARDGGANYQQS